MTISLNDNRAAGGCGMQLLDRELPPGCDPAVDVVDKLAAAVTPQVKDCLVLADYLSSEASAALHVELEGLVSYTWHSEENFEQVHHWYLAAIATKQAQLPYQFFVNAILHRYHYDRAVRASTEHHTKPPVERDKIPSQLRKIRRNDGAEWYELKRQSFAWSREVPDRVVDTVADFMIKTAAAPPDGLWIADYVLFTAHYDPIIYASFGPWEVEVARWD